MKKRLKINKLYIPVFDGKGNSSPKIEGFNMIACKQKKVRGQLYDIYFYVPEFINLCVGGNAKICRGLNFGFVKYRNK